MGAAKTRRSKGFTAEKAAVKGAPRLKAEKSRAEGEEDLLANIAEMKVPIAQWPSRSTRSSRPRLTWNAGTPAGMPAYRNEDDCRSSLLQERGEVRSGMRPSASTTRSLDA